MIKKTPGGKKKLQSICT